MAAREDLATLNSVFNPLISPYDEIVLEDFKGDTLTTMFLFLLFSIQLASGDRIVTTNSGPVRGISLAPKKVEAFLGIPYAEPPVGPLRFAKPVPKSSWKETYDASKLPPACVQMVGFEDYVDSIPEVTEDCLYLNLWVPEGGSDLKPVMLFIHGGGFMMGSSNENNGAALSEHGDVIVASMNYRLGALGFFSGSIEEAAGNMGMHDQVMAMQWIKDNAKHFGGDPDNILIFGESAGAFSVSLHTVSPLSKKLFRRVIMESGSALHPMYSDREAHSKGCQAIATMAGCADDDEALKKNPQKVVECLKKVPAENFSEVDFLYFQRYGMLTPIVGEEFLPEDPIESFRKGDFEHTEILLGVNRDEGSTLLALLNFDAFKDFGSTVSPGNYNETYAKEVLHSIMNKIGGNFEMIQPYIDRVKTEPQYTYLHATGDVAGDYLITCGSVFEADFKSLKKDPVYFYLFDYRSPSLPLPQWAGVPHAEEVSYVFGKHHLYEFSDSEKELSKKMMDMWVAFAKTGNPNIPGRLEWPRYTHEDGKYFVIGQNDRVGAKLFNNRCEIWRDFFRSKIDRDNTH